MSRASWDAPVKICTKAINEIHFWSISLQKLNNAGVDIRKVDKHAIVDIEMFCDASDVGFVGILTTDLNAKLFCKEMSGNWTERERNESSTWRELECVNRFVQTFDSTFSDKTVKINTDNQNVPHILRVGSRKQKLQDIAIDIKQTCVSSNINIITQWVPREKNTHADTLSRHTDHDDLAIHSDIFDEINSLWGPYTIHRFATHYNTQCERFNSKIWYPGTEAVDAFSQNWNTETNWLVPPPSLISMVIRKVENDRANSTLVIPKWKSAPFWPLLFTSNDLTKCIKGLRLEQNVQAAIDNSGVSPDNKLRNLANKMSAFIVESKAENTSKKYFYGFKRWKTFINEHKMSELPANPVHVALYLTYLIDKHCSPSVIDSAVYSFKWAHELNGFNDPTNNSYVKSLTESAKRLNGRPVVKKDPINNTILIDLCSLYERSEDLLIVRDLTMILIGYSGFLRYDELSSLRCKDITVFDDYLEIQILRSKTDQYRQGNKILISKGSTLACPFNIYNRYIQLANLDEKSDLFVFRPIFRSRGIAKLIHKNKKMSYTSAKENIVKRIKIVAPNLNLGLHSLRAGGATTAAQSDVNERCIKRHGRWKSDTSKDGYIDDTFEKRMSVSQIFGL
ncbi:uncharacterized protein LOC127718788 [Mytilus californianus]|uniref:uncharacterized protein LOC127718788 n=1 Tax=Mytilus californianus TaxID=6549 RepID=UPI002246CE1B|nr:uncharacterized protein LOC127718788 [Mytilus californianus]